MFPTQAEVFPPRASAATTGSLSSTISVFPHHLAPPPDLFSLFPSGDVFVVVVVVVVGFGSQQHHLAPPPDLFSLISFCCFLLIDGSSCLSSLYISLGGLNLDDRVVQDCRY